ncbi:hypothetical protein PRIPAC_82400 [Pristionchus pacificus]|uniref:Nuclear receptor n=1 Tax=Pristionchus pacificus TaxID=54126 RepID=A0A8R1V5D1_PRIPA|nr:hypothetical protein PRIPAC_82400 [Pristionchus pacificus]
MAETAHINECLVCSAPNTSLHFGIDACRACTAFFKRATVLGRRYPCRKGQRKCEVTRESTIACRGCRYDRCVAVGMKYDGPMRAYNGPADKFEVECITNEPSTSAVSMLDQIRSAYEKAVAVYKQKELTLLRKCNRAQRVPHISQEVYTGMTEEMHTENVKNLSQEMWTFFQDAFPSLSELSINEQAELFRCYLPNFCLIDTYFRTWKIWRAFDNYVMVTASMCIELKSPYSWMSVDDDVKNRREMVELGELHVRDQVSRLAPLFEKADVTDCELHALLALALCEPDMKTDASDTLLSLLDSIRSQTLREVHRYYKVEMMMADFSARLGNIMTICHAVRECNSHFQEYLRTYATLFDAHSADKMMEKLFL